MKILIVEDEELAAEKLVTTTKLVESGADIVGMTTSIKTTLAWLANNSQPDIILLDIELSDGQSFEIFNQADVTSTVIFITSYDEFALQAFKVNSIDYLLKPVQKEELKKAFEKYKKFYAPLNEASSKGNIHRLIEQMQMQLKPKEYRRRFLVKLAQKHMPVEVKDIACFFIHERITFFKTFENKKFIVDYNMDELEDMLNPIHFFRINRSFMVGIKSILQVHDYFNNRLVLTLQPDVDEQVIVSRDKVNDFKKWIGK